MNAPPDDHRDGDPRFARKADAGKADWTLIPQAALRMMLAAFAYGALKYAARSWREVPDARERYLRSMLRHAQAIAEAVERDGIGALLEADEESALPHLAHLAACCLILIDLALRARNAPPRA